MRPSAHIGPGLQARQLWFASNRFVSKYVFVAFAWAPRSMSQDAAGDAAAGGGAAERAVGSCALHHVHACVHAWDCALIVQGRTACKHARSRQTHTGTHARTHARTHADTKRARTHARMQTQSAHARTHARTHVHTCLQVKPEGGIISLVVQDQAGTEVRARPL